MRPVIPAQRAEVARLHRRRAALPRTFAADFPGTDEVALVPRQDDGRLRLGLPEQEAELRGAVEASPVGHGEDQDAHVALQGGQVLEV